MRLAIIRSLEDSGELTLDELTAPAQVHRNTVRAHCIALEKAGAIERAPSQARGPGRPMLRYRLAALAEPSALARLLGETLAGSGISRRQARRLGRARGAALARLLPKRRRLEALERQLSELGFTADISPRQVELSHCPCPVVSPDDPALVCALVAGTIDGALDASGTSARVAGGDHDPQARRCSLRLATP